MRVGAGRGRLLGVEAVMMIDQRKQIVERSDRLGGAQEQKTVCVQRIMECRNDAFLQRPGEIDQQIAAAYEIDVRKRRVDRDVLLGEYAYVADRLVDAIFVVFPGEKPAQTLRRDFGFDALRIDPVARLLQRERVGEIRRENLDRRASRLVVEEFV